MPNTIGQKVTVFVKEAANEVTKFVKENSGKAVAILAADVLTGGAVSGTAYGIAKATKDTALATALAGVATVDATTGHTISGTAGAFAGTAKATADTAIATALAGAATVDATTGHTISGTAGAIPPLM